MNPDPLDNLLRDYARQPMPGPPDRLTADIWRDIEQRRSRFAWLVGLNWHDLLRRPRLAFSALGIALLAGLAPAVAIRSLDEHARLARASLHFEVFSPDAPSVLVASMHASRK